MEKKTFEISNIQNVDELNALSLALNAKEQVSHMKIGKEHIVFNCIDIEALISLIQSINKEFVVKEVIDGQKRKYDYAQRKETKHYFMFKNMLNENDVYVLIDKIKDDERYKDIEYDSQNKVLTLISSQKDVLSLLRKVLYKINPSMQIIEHRRPIRSQDVFQQKFLKTYLKVGVLLLIIALAIITSKDHTWITPVLWMATVFLFSEPTIKNAIKSIKQKKFFQPDVLFIIALVLCVVSGAYVETCIAVFVYQLATPVLNKVLEYSLKRIDRTVQMPEKGIRYSDDKEEEISLYDFEKDDILVVHPKDTIHMPGIIVNGKSQIDTYSNTSTFELIDASKGSKVHSGDINAGEEKLYIKISKPYESTRFVELMNIASLAPIYESKLEKAFKKLSRYYTPIMFLLSLFVGVVLPIADYDTFASYIHVGAILMMLSGSLSSEQSTSLGVLSGFAKAFESGIIIKSSLGLDSINTTETIIYDRFDGVEVSDEELELFKNLSHTGRSLVIFNDGPVALENDQYTIYNDLTVEEKMNLMDTLAGPVVYIGDSFKDIELLQKSFVGISRGGLANSKVVEHSDIVLIDSNLNRVFETFVIATRMRTTATINMLFSLVSKLILLIAIMSFEGMALWIAVAVDILAGVFVMWNSTRILE